MTGPTLCPKCNGAMVQGRIMRNNEYAGLNQYLYVFAPDSDPGPGLGQIISGNPQSKFRKGLAAFCCEKCGFTEFYGLPAA